MEEGVRGDAAEENGSWELGIWNLGTGSLLVRCDDGWGNWGNVAQLR